MTLRPSPRAIIQFVCKEWQIGEITLLSQARGAVVCEARHAAIWLMCGVFKFTHEKAGAALNRHSTTASHSMDTARALMGAGGKFPERIERLTAELRDQVRASRRRQGLIVGAPSKPQKKPTFVGVMGVPAPHPMHEQIRKLRDEKKASLKFICKHLGLSQDVVAPIIGVRQHNADGDGP